MTNTTHIDHSAQPDPRRWKALVLLCTAFFMVILDSAIVLVALPSIDADLGFSAGSLQWVLSAYLLSFGGLLLLGGRAADLLGRRRMFVVGTGLFAVASLGAGLAGTVTVLLAARVLQGVAAAVMTPTALSILMTTFEEGRERNKALGVWGSTGAIGGTAAWLVGGPITSGLGWEWIFFINVPVAVGVIALSPLLLSESRAVAAQRRFDVAGAVTITAALVALVYAVVEAPEAGWADGQTLGLLGLALLLTVAFAGIESRSAAPLAPLRVFRSRPLVGGNLLLFALGTFAFGVPFILTQYAQEVLDWSPIQFGLASVVMPVAATIGTFSAQALATERGVRGVAMAAMVLTGVGSLLFSQVSVDGTYLGDLFLGLLILGPGIGAAYVAGSIASLTGVAEREAGLASGLNNASFQIGGAVGVAVLSTVAVSGAHGPDSLAALTNGYQDAFTVAIAAAVLGLLVAGLLLGGRREPEPVGELEAAGAERAVVHMELHTSDLVAASGFYSRVLGWRPEWIETRAGSYFALATGGKVSAGIAQCSVDRAVWVPYVEVDRIYEVTDRARRAGARVSLGPCEGPAGWRSVVSPPDGGEIAFWQPKEWR